MAPNAPVIMPPLCPQILIHTKPNPNNKSVQQVETLNFPSYYITPTECNEIYLHLGQIVNLTSSLIIVEQCEEENLTAGIEQSRPGSPTATPKPTTIHDIRLTTATKDTSCPPYPERLSLVKADP